MSARSPPDVGTDANDYHQKYGLDALAKAAGRIGLTSFTYCPGNGDPQARHRGYGGSRIRGPFDPPPEPCNSLNLFLDDPIVTMKMGDKDLKYTPFDSLPFTDDDEEEE